MGTAYYRPKYPITHIEVSEGVTHDSVKLWDRGGLAGELTFLTGHSAPFIEMLKNPLSVARTWWSGERSGMHVSIDPSLHDGQVLISERGALTTVRQLREQAGRRER